MPSLESSDSHLPLDLCEVLEEEYVALHGQLKNVRGWDFVDSDFVVGKDNDKNPALELWQTLQGAGAGNDNDFTRHLRDRIAAADADADAAVLTEPDPGDAARLARLLNKVLGDPRLYAEEATRRLPSPRRHEELLVPRPTGGQDLRRFNRVLLEDAYPETLRRIYEIRLENIIGEIHATPRAALCLSGGGIRSGTFALGILQGLARRELLPEFHYLSTISGGGYIGSWFTAWCHRHPRGFLGVQDDLAGKNPPSKIEPEARPVRHLREFSNFVAPRLSLISADVWSFVAIYLRNLLINWSVLFPYLLALLLIPRVLVAGLYAQWPTALKVGAFGLGLLLAVAAVFHITLNRPSRADALFSAPSWFKRRDQKTVLWRSIVPAAVSGACLAMFWGLYQGGSPPIITESFVPMVNVPSSFSWVLSWTPAWIPSWIPRSIGCLVVCFGPFLVILGILLYLASSLLASAVVRRRPKFGDITAAVVTGAVGGALTWLLLRTLFESPMTDRLSFEVNAALYVVLAVPAYMLVFFVGATAFVAATSQQRKGRRRRELFSIDDEDREWLGRHAAWLLIAGCAWLVLSGLAIFGPLLLLQSPRLVTSLGGVSGLVALILGRSAKTPASGDKAKARSATDLLLEHALSVAAVIFIAVLLAGISLFAAWFFGWVVHNSSSLQKNYEPPAIKVPLADIPGEGPRSLEIPRPFTVGSWTGQLAILYFTPWWLVLAVFAGSWLFAVTLGRLVNLNKFSLHAAYRARIIRAFLGASRSPDERDPNPFTGFDPQDNVQMHELRPGLISEVSFKPGQLAVFVARLRDSHPAMTTRLGIKFVPLPFFEQLGVDLETRCLRALYVQLPAARAGGEDDADPDGRFVAGLNDLTASHDLRTLLQDDGRPTPPDGARTAPQSKGQRPDDGIMRENRRILHKLFGQPNRPPAPDDEAALNRDSFTKGVAPLRQKVRNVPYDALYRKLSPRTRYLLANHEGLNPPSPSLKRQLIGDVNRVLEAELPELDPLGSLVAVPATVELWKKVWAPARPLVDGAKAPWEKVWEEGRFTEPTNSDLLKSLPDRGRGEAAVLMKRSILDAAFSELKRLPSPPPPWAKERLMHVVGTALNLVGGKRLAWQQRQAESFTISPLHSGSLFTGYRRTRKYGGEDGISLGTAVTISGAAVSSNMGYHSSSAPVTFVLTLLNARLGWWLGNPGPAGANTYTAASPESSLTPIRLEAFGLTDDASDYVLLSDGGHFDNLGIYEMVLRRCRLILAVDGSQDGEATFDDLGSTIRKIRIDLGINIDFLGPMRIEKRRAPKDDNEKTAQAPRPPGKYCAIARIKYSDRDGGDPNKRDGLLIYVKPALYGGEPRDVVNYGAANRDFPHQSTADQLFDEPQFESYRMLGSDIADRIFGKKTDSKLPDVVEAVYAYLEKPGESGENEELIKEVCAQLKVPQPKP